MRPEYHRWERHWQMSMTYCLAIALDKGLVFVSDSRTNAGVDMVSVYSKMTSYGVPGERQFTLLTSGNLATSQAVNARLRKDIRDGSSENLYTLGHMTDVAEYIGSLSREEQQKSGSEVNTESYFIIGGQIAGGRPGIFLIYPQGNYISTSIDTPYLQIGESKYGKPILDRILTPSSNLETAAMCALVSMDSTMRSNVGVGPPIEMSIYECDALQLGRYYKFEEDSEYLRELKRSWDKALKAAFLNLPPVTWSVTWDQSHADNADDAAQ